MTSSVIGLLLLAASATAERAADAPAPGPAEDARPARYYVDSAAGADTASGTSPAAAWRTLARINGTRLWPGDVVSFKRGGTYRGQLLVRSSGAPGHPITFTSYGEGPLPVLDNGGGTRWPANVITLQRGASHVIVEQLLLRNTHVAAVEIGPGSHHNVVRDTEMSDAGAGVSVFGPFNLVTRNHVHDLHMVVNDAKPGNDYGAVGVNLEASDNEVSYNRFVRCRAPSIDYGQDGGAVEFHRDVSRSKVHHNYAEDSEGFMEIGGPPGSRCTDNEVSYNVAVNCSSFAVFHNRGALGVEVKRFRVENNTIVTLQGREPVFWFKDPPTADTASIRNNLVVMGPGIRVANRSGFRHDHNLFWHAEGSGSLGLGLDPTELNADPRLVDLARKDFHLDGRSPAAGRGVALGHPRDFDGARVPPDAAPSIGAYERSAGR